MKTSLRYLMLSAVTSIGMVGAAVAQPRPTGVTAEVQARVATYSAGIAALVPAATATDFFTITGAANVVVRVKSVECTGVTTANASAVIQALMRSAANTGGTSTVPAAVPMDSNDAASVAVVNAYTANPASLGAIIGSVLRVGRLTTTTVATSTIETTPPLVWTFGLNGDKEPTLRGAAQVFALNAAGASLSAGASISCDAEWTETPN